MFLVDSDLMIIYELSHCTINLSILQALNNVVDYICIFTYILFFTASPGQRVSNDLSAPSTMRTHRTKLTPRRPPAFRGEVTLNQPFTHTPPPTTTTPPKLPPLHTITPQQPAPHNHSFGPHRQKWYVQPIRPCSGPSECDHRNCERRSRTQNRPRACQQQHTTRNPSAASSFSVDPSVSRSIQHTRAHADNTASEQTTRYQTSHRPLTSHGPTGAKHKLQGGLLPLRQARQRPCRARRPW
jgi:hypothetical protein